MRLAASQELPIHMTGAGAIAYPHQDVWHKPQRGFHEPGMIPGKFFIVVAILKNDFNSTHPPIHSPTQPPRIIRFVSELKLGATLVCHLLHVLENMSVLGLNPGKGE